MHPGNTSNGYTRNVEKSNSAENSVASDVGVLPRSEDTVGSGGLGEPAQLVYRVLK